MVLGLTRSSKVKDLEGQLKELKKDFTEMYNQAQLRPNIDQLYMTRETGGKIPIYPIPIITAYELAKNVDGLGIPLQSLRREIFKNGLEVAQRFMYKCNSCGKEFKDKPVKVDEETKQMVFEGGKKVLECDTCLSHDLKRPDPKHAKKLREWYGSDNGINLNKQSLQEVLYENEWDVDVADWMMVLLMKSYSIDKVTKNIVGADIKEVIRGSPLTSNIIADKTGRIGYDDSGRKVYVCPRIEDRQQKQYSERCNQCGAQTLPAIMESNPTQAGIYGTSSEYKTLYYAEGEVIWKSKYMPTLLYGFPPIMMVWIKVLTLFYQDNYLMKYFEKERPPKGVFLVASRNIESVHTSWQKLMEEIRNNPHAIYPLTIETEKAGKTSAQWIDLMRSLEEMQFIESRNEYRRTIGAVFGVLPLFQGDLPHGWENEGLQVAITNRAVEWGQQILNEFLLRITRAIFGFDDYVIRFVRNEEVDEMRLLQIEGQRITNAMGMSQLGFAVERTHDGDFKYDKVPTEESRTEQIPTPPMEQRTTFQGEPKIQRPSDQGGPAQGFPASGPGTSLSHKSMVEDDVALYDVIYSDLQSMNKANIASDVYGRVLEQAGGKAWLGSFEGVDFKKSRFARDLMKEQFRQRKGVRQAAVEINKNVPEMPLEQAYVVVKTEFEVMKRRAREIAFEKTEPKAQLYWDNKKDARDCEVCKEINKLTRKGVSMARLKQIVKSTSESFGFTGARDLLPHPLCRCSIDKVEKKKRG